MNASYENGLILATILFLLGFYGLLRRKNIIFILLCLEIMFNAAGMMFILASSRWNQVDGQIMFLMILTVAAAEVAIALAIVIQYFQKLKTLDVDAAGQLKG